MKNAQIFVFSEVFRLSEKTFNMTKKNWWKMPKITHFRLRSLTSEGGSDQGIGVEQAVLARLADSLCLSYCLITFDNLN